MGSPSTTKTYGYIFCALAIGISSILIQARHSPRWMKYLPQNVASTKSYESFESFYPHYLDEHTLHVTRQLHYVGTSLFLVSMVMKPILIIPAVAAAMTGYSLVPFLRGFATGIPEMAIMLLIYILGGRLLGKSYVAMMKPLVFSYSFAWIGHFFYEKNKPATFIYPTYSFMGDFRLVFDAIKSQISS
ncbi:unnamed protein product [Didymodactylos carnosus]|uniref:Transmembrane protein n=1 Tax=Didymodactylos carnosus TaxID=1234261 RepID=A0A8S2SRP8_9BILA|nr:unnamed protein product [Didymodactylos carnosus]CAF4247185.1 unnamed protein product [Didymodactylos carnosus]